MVIGSGLGELKRNPLFPHQDFFNECPKPAFYFVVKDYGHLDMVDDETKGIRGKSTYCLCKNGESKEGMRRICWRTCDCFNESLFGRQLKGVDGC